MRTNRNKALLIGVLTVIALSIAIVLATTASAVTETSNGSIANAATIETSAVSVASLPATPTPEMLQYKKDLAAYTAAKAKYDKAKDKHDAYTEYVERQSKTINNYLKGSPLKGQGKNFVLAGIKYKTDPRISPAISCIESGKGRHCFRPHNAWGMMGHSFKSWKQGIYHHNQLLRKLGCRPNVTLSVARKYCPPTYKHWFSGVKREMNKMKRYKYVPDCKVPTKPVAPVKPVTPSVEPTSPLI